MSATRTARERARAELTQEIKEEARRQLAAQGAQRLSLRAVARELGMVSSALYRYFPSRDDLLTALIIDAYESLADHMEAADTSRPGADLRGRWRAMSHAVRQWALASPHEYALVYGTPVPGYSAPQETVGPAGRIPIALLGLARDAWARGALVPGADGPPLPRGLAEQTEQVAAAVAPGLPGPVLARCAIAWTQLFGMISFELFGHLVGSVDPADEFFAHAVEQMADLVGLPAGTSLPA
ncbi:TetR/AcrR family transcriptional regulator [Actinomadura scrupuli]|uniref:TetR/AcrR family transcriptional regulator n=1 Tax=Actinomadura scrupuli TaxID=559629 RepID=UPI003D96EA46